MHALTLVAATFATARAAPAFAGLPGWAPACGLHNSRHDRGYNDRRTGARGQDRGARCKPADKGNDGRC